MSDLHLETLPYPDAFNPARPAFDVLVAAGDIWEGDCNRAFKMLTDLAQGKPVIFVMGNHEHWNGVLDEDLAQAKLLARQHGVTLLDGEAVTIAGCHFVGGTLWTNYALAGAASEPRAETGEQIDIVHDGGTHLITVGDAIKLHAETRSTLENLIADADDALPLVVVTHHAPHPDCVPQSALGTWRAGNIASDLSHLTDTGRVTLWVHGHTHHCIDLMRPGGTRIVANMPGPAFFNPEFNETLVITV